MSLPDWLPAWLLVLVFNFVLQLGGFTLAFALQTERFFDLFGAGNFLLVSIGTWLISDEVADGRRIATTLLFAASRAWLLFFLTIRARERGDSRFDEVKGKCGAFLAFWIGQALWVFLVSLPVVAINSAEGWTPELDAIGICFAVLFAASLLTQIHSDWVKRQWVSAGRPGNFCQRGCWKFSRHPNYCGEITMGIAAIGLVAPVMHQDGKVNGLAIASVLSPLFTFLVLMCASGMPMAEGAALRRYYEKAPKEYEAYRARAPILLPWPCPGYSRVPDIIKRLFCCEWKQYALPDEVRSQLNTTPVKDFSDQVQLGVSADCYDPPGQSFGANNSASAPKAAAFVDTKSGPKLERIISTE